LERATPPVRMISASAFCGVICATAHSAVFAAFGLQNSPTNTKPKLHQAGARRLIAAAFAVEPALRHNRAGLRDVGLRIDRVGR